MANPEDASRAGTGVVGAATAEPLRIGIIGAGLMGGWHAHAACRSGGKVVAVVDPDAARAGELAARHRGASHYRRLEDALTHARLDAAHVCTPELLHFEQARELLTAGVHVLVEKPVAPRADSTAELVELAERLHLHFCPVHQFLFQPGFLQCLNLLPRLGALRHVDFVACSAGAEGRDDTGRNEVVASVLVHPLSLLARIFPSPLTEIVWQVNAPSPGELRAQGEVDGASIGIVVSMAGRPTVNQLRVVAGQGTVHVDLFHGFATFERGVVSTTRKIAHPFSRSVQTFGGAASNLIERAWRNEPAYPGLRLLISRFYAALRSLGPGPIAAGEINSVAKARDLLVDQLR